MLPSAGLDAGGRCVVGWALRGGVKLLSVLSGAVRRKVWKLSGGAPRLTPVLPAPGIRWICSSRVYLIPIPVTKPVKLYHMFLRKTCKAGFAGRCVTRAAANHDNRHVLFFIFQCEHGTRNSSGKT